MLINLYPEKHLSPFNSMTSYEHQSVTFLVFLFWFLLFFSLLFFLLKIKVSRF